MRKKVAIVGGGYGGAPDDALAAPRRAHKELAYASSGFSQVKSSPNTTGT